jgi:hypothetical protein
MHDDTVHKMDLEYKNEMIYYQVVGLQVLDGSALVSVRFPTPFFFMGKELPEVMFHIHPFSNFKVHFQVGN